MESNSTLNDEIKTIIGDENFIANLKMVIDELRAKRLTRENPKPGYSYRRDWYDRMTDAGNFTVDFILSEAENVWLKKSNLSSEMREVIAFVINDALEKTFRDEQDKKDCPLTIKKAFSAIKSGKKVLHKYFLADQFLKKSVDQPDYIEDSNGYTFLENEFFEIYKGDHFAKGWEIVKDDN